MNGIEILKEENRKLVEKIIENMKKGYIFKPDWEASVLRPQNPVSEAIYKGRNKLTLMIQALEKGYDDPRWLTFNQAKEKGWHIKKGERGTRCVKVISTEKVKEKDEKTGELVEVERELAQRKYNFFTVFNANQIEGIPPLEKIKPDKSQISEIINDVIASSECPIKFVAQTSAFYSPSKDEIVLPLRVAFKSEESFLATTLHEMGHSTGHESRLNRDIKNTFGSKDYAKEELVAELCSVFTQARLNVKLEGEHFNNHSAYLESWIKVLEEEPNILFKVAREADKASERIYNNYLEKEKEVIKQLNKEIANTDKPKESENNNITEEKEKQRRFFRGLVIDFYWAEKDLGIKENITLRATEAYKFLEKLIKEDIEQNKRQNYLMEEEKKGNFIPGALYYKTKLAIQYAGYKTGDIHIDLGDLEFGGKTKVSDALEERLKLFPKELIHFKEDFAKRENTTPQDIVETANKILQNIDNVIGKFRKQEEMYLTNLQQKQDIALEPVKENPFLKKAIQDRTMQLTLSR